MIRTYVDLLDDERKKLGEAWAVIVQGLRVYEDITGAELEDFIYAVLWDEVQNQKTMEA